MRAGTTAAGRISAGRLRREMHFTRTHPGADHAVPAMRLSALSLTAYHECNAAALLETLAAVCVTACLCASLLVMRRSAAVFLLLLAAGAVLWAGCKLSARAVNNRCVRRRLSQSAEYAAYFAQTYPEQARLLVHEADCAASDRKAGNPMAELKTAYERVQAARSSKRPMGAYYIEHMIDDFVELHGDRRFGDDGAIIGGIGYLNDLPVTVIAMERGTTIEERMQRHFGCPKPEGYRKALRLMKEAEKFHRPVICLIGSSGAYCGIDAEERGQGEAIAENLFEMMGLKTPVISVVVGEGGSGGALALGVCDTAVMLENAVYSVISPEGCATILWKDAAKAAEAAEHLRLTSYDLKEFGIIEKLIPEQGRSDREICSELKKFLLDEIARLSRLSPEELLQGRYDKFRGIGAN